jgi:hypothetical protein
LADSRPPVRAEITFGGIPAWLLTAYLVEMGGAEDGNETVRGERWTAKLASDKRRVGSIALGRVTVTIDGPAAEETMAVLRKKAQRGGG